ncbi:MAG: hypothetical protein ABSF45_25425 [Terriglobia bacterium]|jgi:hypothetical protein
MFRRVLIATWSLFLSIVALLFLFPGFTSHYLLYGHARVIGYAIGFMLIATWTYRLAGLYRIGMAKTRKP